MFTIEEARTLLKAANVFYDIDEEDDEEDQKFAQALNMNDVWGWAYDDCEFVKDEELPEVAELFRAYGWCGILYWVSEKRKGLKSEFSDNNRFIQFVENEEKIKREMPDDDKRAYKKAKYLIKG